MRYRARTDLCGGCPVTGIPTTTHVYEMLFESVALVNSSHSGVGKKNRFVALEFACLGNPH